LISHFTENTEFTIKQIEKLGDSPSPNTDGLDVVTVSKRGEDFDLRSSLAEGKVTIVDFYADWCVPCKVLEKKLVAYMKEHPGIALRKVNIVDWKSEAAKTHLRGVKGIPYVLVFEASGKELYRGAGDIDRVLDAIEAFE